MYICTLFSVHKLLTGTLYTYISIQFLCVGSVGTIDEEMYILECGLILNPLILLKIHACHSDTHTSKSKFKYLHGYREAGVFQIESLPWKTQFY